MYKYDWRKKQTNLTKQRRKKRMEDGWKERKNERRKRRKKKTGTPVCNTVNSVIFFKCVLNFIGEKWEVPLSGPNCEKHPMRLNFTWENVTAEKC